MIGRRIAQGLGSAWGKITSGAEAVQNRILTLKPAAATAFWLGLLLFALLVPPTLTVWETEPGSGDTVLTNLTLYSAVRIGIFIIAALGLNVQVGYTGLLNLGFAGFMAIGAYTCGALMKTYEWPFWLALPAAVLHGALWGILLGVPTLRLTGDYFAIVTFGFSELVLLVAKNWRSVTGGVQGMNNIPRPQLGPLGQWLEGMGVDPRWYVFKSIHAIPYWFLTVLCVAAACFVMWRLTHSRVGRAWRAIREDEVAAEACGVHCNWNKTLAFVASAALGGGAGALLAVFQGGVYPNNFRFLESVIILVYVVFGGMGSILGTTVGTVVLMSLLEWLRGVIEDYNTQHDASLPAEVRFVIFGLILILIMRFRPEGILPSRRVQGELHPDTLEEARRESEGLYQMRNPSQPVLR